MDSKVVNRYIREIIRPTLKAKGFSKFTSRNAWRYRGNVIDVVNFQSFNSYNADVMGVTTYSFCVKLGSFHIDIPTGHQKKIKVKSNLLCPEEYECSFRGGLKRAINQKEIEQLDIWYIRQDGSNIKESVVDARNQIMTFGLDWFTKLETKEALKDILINKRESMGELWGFGNKPSPLRSYLLGYVELILGNATSAQKSFKSVIESGCYSEFFKTVDEAVARVL